MLSETSLYVKINFFLTLNVDELVIFGNSLAWFLNLNLTFKRLCVGVRCGLLVLLLGKLGLFYLINQ